MQIILTQHYPELFISLCVHVFGKHVVIFGGVSIGLDWVHTLKLLEVLYLFGAELGLSAASCEVGSWGSTSSN